MTDNTSGKSNNSGRTVAQACIDAGIESAHPVTVISDSISLIDNELHINDTVYDLSRYEKIVVLGGGNAAGKVAADLEGELGDRITDGVVVTDVLEPTTTVDLIEGNHPVPDQWGAIGAKQVLDHAKMATTDTLVFGIITGGGSALLPAPAGDISLADLQTVTNELLASGATIHEINAVRKHLSAIKGGRLAAAATPATVIGLVFSDVIGNDLDVIASGPLVPDTSTYDDAQDVLQHYDITPPESVQQRLDRGLDGTVAETPAPGDDAFAAVDTHVLADGMTALTAAANTASDYGYTPLILSSRVRGEAREAAKTHVGIAEEIRATGHPIAPPAVVLSGGETTVTLSNDGDGSGGPNQEFALSAAIELNTEGIIVASVDTDGIDGASDAAGAIVDVNTTKKTDMAEQRALTTNDVTPFLDAAGALVETEPTGTNVNDLRMLVITPRSEYTG